MRRLFQKVTPNSRPKVFGVLHRRDMIDLTKERLGMHLQEGQRIGIEPSPDELLLFQEALSHADPHDYIEAEVRQRDHINKLDILLRIDERMAALNFLHFYFEIYRFLLARGVIPIAIDTTNRTQFHYDTMKMWANSDKKTRKRIQQDRRLAITQFDREVSDTIRKERLDGVVVGSRHCDIARLASGDYIDLSESEIVRERGLGPSSVDVSPSRL